MSLITDFIYEFNTFYPFKRYIVKYPKKINDKYEDALLTEIFIPDTKIEPILCDGNFMGYSDVDTDEIYIKIKGNAGEMRFAYNDFCDGIKDTIRNIIIDDFGIDEWQNLFIEDENANLNKLKENLLQQQSLIKEKYGECKIKDYFVIEDTINLIKQ